MWRYTLPARIGRLPRNRGMNGSTQSRSCLGGSARAGARGREETARHARAQGRADGRGDVGGDAFCNINGNSGLATSGSRDTLPGLISGLAARGAEPAQAAVWAFTCTRRRATR